MTLVTITAANDEYAQQLQSFGDALIASNWWSVVGSSYGVGPAAQSLHLTGPAITQSLDGPSVVSYIEGVIAGGGPQPNGQTMYLVYLPDGVTLTDAPSSACAYHNIFPDFATSLGDCYGAVERCEGAAQSVYLPTVTAVASHEVIEAATDPLLSTFTWGSQPADPWAGPLWAAAAGFGPEEAADPCIGTLIWEDGGLGDFQYQRVWSNAAVDAGGDPCVPAQSGPYYNVSIGQDWYATDGGSAVEIPITGWSTAQMGDWLVYATAINASTGYQALLNQSLAVTTPLGYESPAGLCPVATYGINDGVGGTLEVPTLPALSPGDFVVVQLQSFLVDQSCNWLANQDHYHSNLVGVYVPLDPAQVGACGLYNFSTACTNAPYYCPANGSCQASYECACDQGSVDVDCAGDPCSLLDGGCRYPNWWCAPRQAGSCGAQNSTVPCSDGHGGLYYCPTHSSCAANRSCACGAGFAAVTCAGSPCNGACSYPDWWCN